MTSDPIEFHQGDYTISTDTARLDLDLVHHFLSTQSYWSPGISRELVQRAMEGALCFGVYAGEDQIGYARVITDQATLAYLADVFILEAYRGQGLGKWLVSCILSHPDLQGLRRWLLNTHDAHSLYAQFGFTPLAHPENQMELRPDSLKPR